MGTGRFIWSSHLVMAACLLLTGCSRNAPSTVNGGTIIPAGGSGENTRPMVGAEGVPVETAPPNVTYFKPAFPSQTRAPALVSRTALDVREIANGLDNPWALAFLPDGRMLVTEKHSGRLRILNRNGERSEPATGVPRVDGRDQGGLLHVVLDPNHGSNNVIYLSYYEPRNNGNGLAVARATLSAEQPPRLENVQVIFRMQPTLDSTKHAGGRIVFAPDGTLFITLGDRSILEGRRQSRDLRSHFGKVVRIHPDGRIPDDNPFLERPEARPEIWATGIRNTLGAALDDQNRLWTVDMGPRGGDELNLISRGRDYGWPTIGYGEEYTGVRIHQVSQAPGLEQPIYYWDPVISPGALAIYSGRLIPEWRGNLLIAGLSGKALVRLVLENDRVVGEERLLAERQERLRDVVEGPEGALFVLTDGADAKLLRLTPAP